MQKLDFPWLLNTIEKRFEISEKRFADAEKHLREELTARIAMNIEPYIEKTVRRVNDLNENVSALEDKFGNQQEILEERFSVHQETIALEGDKLVSKFTKSGDRLINDWQNAQQTVQTNLSSVNVYAKKMYNEIGSLQNAQNRVENAGNIFAQRIKLWTQVTEELEIRNGESSRMLVQEQEQVSLKIRAFGARTIKNYKSMVFIYRTCLQLID